MITYYLYSFILGTLVNRTWLIMLLFVSNAVCCIVEVRNSSIYIEIQIKFDNNFLKQFKNVFLKILLEISVTDHNKRTEPRFSGFEMTNKKRIWNFFHRLVQSHSYSVRS